MVTFDAATIGTPASAWRVDPRVRDAPGLELHGVARLIVVAAHPDDETLGAGGLIAAAADRGIDTMIVVVTDGDASHSEPVADRRSRELIAAIAELSPEAVIRQLGFPDGQTDRFRQQIAEALAGTLGPLDPSTLIAAPWRGDGHRDHRVVGEIVHELAGVTRLLEYPIWMWHWATPDDPVVPWPRAVRVPVDLARKRCALQEYRSQIEGPHPMLHAATLDYFDAVDELFFHSGSIDLDRHFDDKYRARPDPWGYTTRWYERRKRALTLASLPDERYTHALEIGCSIGVLTSELAERCDRLVALDISAVAVARARDRVGPAADIRVADARSELPDGPFDLVVLSEVGYYWSADDLSSVLRDLRAKLTDDAVLVACHWLTPIDDGPLDGAKVHRLIGESGMRRTVRHLDEEFLLEVYRNGRS